MRSNNTANFKPSSISFNKKSESNERRMILNVSSFKERNSSTVSGGSSNRTDSNNIDENLRKCDKKFTGRCRLFVGNLPNDISETEFKELFSKYGETGEVFLNTSGRSFGFIKLVFNLLLFKAKIVSRHNTEFFRIPERMQK